MTIKQWLIKIQLFLIVAFIVLSPINKAISLFFNVGFSPLTIIICLIVLLQFAIDLFFDSSLRINRLFFYCLPLVFFIELLLNFGANNIGLVLAFLLFVSFTNFQDELIANDFIALSFLVSVVFASIFSVIFGLSKGAIVRTATMVDSSVGLSSLIVFLFYRFKINNLFLKFLRNISFLCCILTLAFSMSRSRLIIAAVLIILKIVSLIFDKKARKEAMKDLILIGIVFLFVFLIAFINFDIVIDLINNILFRFSDGISSPGRNEEMAFGITLFCQNPVFGVGWKDFYYLDYMSNWSSYDNHNLFVGLLARGGLALFVPTMFILGFIIYKSFKSKKAVAIASSIVVFILCFANCGFFNYTICAMLIISSACFKKYNNQDNYGMCYINI